MRNKSQVFELSSEKGAIFFFQGIAQNGSETMLLILAVSLPTAVPWAAEGTGP